MNHLTTYTSFHSSNHKTITNKRIAKPSRTKPYPHNITPHRYNNHHHPNNKHYQQYIRNSYFKNKRKRSSRSIPEQHSPLNTTSFIVRNIEQHQLNIHPKLHNKNTFGSMIGIFNQQKNVQQHQLTDTDCQHQLTDIDYQQIEDVHQLKQIIESLINKNQKQEQTIQKLTGVLNHL